MVRALSTAQKALINDQVDLDPVVVVYITIGSSTYRYADKDFTYTTTTTNDTFATGRLETVSDIQFQTMGETVSTIGTLNVSIIDVDEAIRTILDSKSYHDAEVTVYLALNSTFTDFTALFTGQIRSPYIYDDVARVVSFDVFPKINSVQFPWAPTEEGTDDGDNNTHPLLLGNPWPIGFGRVTDVKAVLFKQPDVVRLRSGIDESPGITCWFDTVPDFLDSNPHFTTSSREYMLGRELMSGAWASANNGRLNVNTAASSRNRVHVTANATSRPTVGQDPDTNRLDVIYITQRVVGLWVQLRANSTNQEHYCIAQIGNKCFFDANWSTKITNGKSFTATRYSTKSGTRWSHGPGTLLRRNQGDGGWKKVFVFSDGPVNSVKAVRAWRNVPVIGGTSDGSTLKQLVYVPSSYYTIDYNADQTKHDLPGATNVKAATIKFDPALEFRQQGWEADEIYVSYVSDYTTSGGERNIVDHLAYILDTYTDLTIDATSKAAVRTLVTNFPADFAITQQKDALQAAAEIAEQCLIALVVTGDTVKFKYLGINDPTAGDGQFPLTEDNCILMDQTEVAATELEDIYTVYKATYQNSYAYPAPLSMTLRTNVAQFDERFKTLNYIIYQRKKLVEPFAEWWARQLAYPWRILTINVTLEGLEYEPYDIVELDSTITDMLGVTGDVYGRVMAVRNSLEGYANQLQVWTPIVDGTSAIATYGYDAPTTPSTSVRADPFANYPTSFADDIEAVAVPFDGA